ncbi:MAG: hypothetical protein ABF391_10415 [Akkermansiaceae bacterium]|jgi:hypothetical protein
MKTVVCRWIASLMMLTLILNSISCQSIDDVNLDVRDEVETHETPKEEQNTVAQRSRDGYALFLNMIRLPIFALVGLGTLIGGGNAANN